MKKIILINILFVFFSCSSSWNSPFINSKDIVLLEFGMSKSDVLEIMPGPPLYVESGNSETSVWVYNVRTIKVKSAQNINGKVIPQKNSEKLRHQSKIDDLYLTFDSEDKLLAWGNKAYDPNYVEPYYDCADICNGTAYIDECGICISDSNEVDNNSEKSESFKLELNIEGTKNPDGNLIIKGNQND